MSHVSSEVRQLNDTTTPALHFANNSYNSTQACCMGALHQ